MLTATPTLEDLDAIVPELAAPASTKQSKAVSVRCGNELAGKIAAFTLAKTAAADATAMQEMHGADIKKFVETQRVLECQSRNELVQTLSLDGVLNYTLQDKFQPIKAEALPAVAAAFGADYDRFITIDVSQEINRPQLSAQIKDPEVVAAFKLLRQRGIITQTRTGLVTSRLFHAMSFDDRVRKIALDLGLKPQAMLSLAKAVSK